MLVKKLFNGVEVLSIKIAELKSALREIALRIVRDRQELKRMILFGSFVNGDFTPHSDVDIALIVSGTDKFFIERPDDFWEYFKEIPLDVNLLVYTEKEVEAMAGRGERFIGEVLKGKI